MFSISSYSEKILFVLGESWTQKRFFLCAWFSQFKGYETDLHPFDTSSYMAENQWISRLETSQVTKRYLMKRFHILEMIIIFFPFWVQTVFRLNFWNIFLSTALNWCSGKILTKWWSLSFGTLRISERITVTPLFSNHQYLSHAENL